MVVANRPTPPSQSRQTHTAQSTERERERAEKNLSPRTGTARTEAGLTSGDDHGDQASGAHYPAATNQLTAIPHHRGRNFGTVPARPGRRQDWIFDGRGEGSPEILADFSSSDFRRACLLTRSQSHASPSLMSRRLDELLMCACLLSAGAGALFSLRFFVFSFSSSASLLLHKAGGRPEEKRGLKD